MAQSKKGGVNLAVDFKEIAEFIGEGEAWVALSKDRAYLKSVMNNAFEEANERFNVQAAAAAASGAANIKHMFEWGTLGINTGQTNRRPRPTSEGARLWTTMFRGAGTNRSIDFNYKLSTAKVPLPNKKTTGMSISSTKLKRNHVFRWKAKVMESGASVSIKNKNKNKRFLVFPNRNAKGFTFIHRNNQPVTAVPGRSSAGQFNAFFTAYWNGEGREIMEKKFAEAFEETVVKEMNDSTPGPLKPAGTPFRADANKAKERAINNAKRRVSERNAK